MKTFLSILIIGFSFHLKADCQKTGEHTTKSGYKIVLPLCYEPTSRSVVVEGSISLTAAQAAMKGLSVYPIPFKTFGREPSALMQIWFVDYQNTSIGPYREIVVNILSSKTPIEKPLSHLEALKLMAKIFSEAGSPETPYFVYKLWVNTPIALEAGNEIWGFNKSLAQIDVTESGAKLFETGETILSVSFPKIPGFPVTKANKPFHVFAYTSGNEEVAPHLVKSQAWNNGTLGLYDLYPGPGSTLQFNESSEWGAKLSRFQFYPQRKFVMDIQKAMIFAD